MQGNYGRTDLLRTISEYPGLLDERQKQELVKMSFAHQQFDGEWFHAHVRCAGTVRQKQ
jgi:hypothetical protein